MSARALLAVVRSSVYEMPCDRKPRHLESQASGPDSCSGLPRIQPRRATKEVLHALQSRSPPDGMHLGSNGACSPDGEQVLLGLVLLIFR